MANKKKYSKTRQFPLTAISAIFEACVQSLKVHSCKQTQLQESVRHVRSGQLLSLIKSGAFRESL